jgi:hypothetical protein
LVLLLQEDDIYKGHKRKKYKKSNLEKNKKENRNEEVLITDNSSDSCQTIDQELQNKENNEHIANNEV